MCVMTLKGSLMTQQSRLRQNDQAPITGTNPQQVFLTAAEAAALLRLSPITLSRWRIQGYGPRWTKMGRKRVCYALNDLRAFTDAQKRTSTSDQ
jgi:hypothetical protein